MIDKCQFGSMEIENRRHTSDLLIFPDGRVVDGWRRAAGHRLSDKDIAPLLAAKPEILVVGTGIFGRMRLQAEVEIIAAQYEIEVIAKPTKSAAERFNQLKKTGKRVGACFHLTC